MEKLQKQVQEMTKEKKRTARGGNGKWERKNEKKN